MDTYNENATGAGGINAYQGTTAMENDTVLDGTIQPCHDYVTVVTADRPIGKHYTESNDLANGLVDKTTAAAISTCTAQTVHVPDLAAYDALRRSLEPNQDLINGFIPDTVDGTPYTLDSMSVLNGYLGNPEDTRPVGLHPLNGSGLHASRIKENFAFSSYLTLDRDVDSNRLARGPFDELTSQEWLNQVATVFPELVGAGYLFSPSSSSRVRRGDGFAPFTGNSAHYTIKVSDPTQIPALKHQLKVRSWINDLGYIKTGKAGARLKRTILDLTVMSPERFIFESPPTAGCGITLDPPETQHFDGPDVVLNDIQPPSEAELAEYAKRTGEAFTRNADGSLTGRTVDQGTLGLDSPIMTTAGAEVTLRTCDLEPGKKIRCHVPDYVRAGSSGDNGYIGSHQNGELFFYDNGTDTKYLPHHFEPIPVPATPPVDAWDMDIYGYPSVFNPMNIPQRKFILGKRFMRGYVTAVIAPGGVGKSVFTLVDAIAVVTGRALLGETVHEPTSVLVINNEDDKDELDRRVAAILQQYQIPYAEISGEATGRKLHMFTGYGCPFVAVRTDSAGNITTTPYIDKTVEYVNAHGIGMMSVDPFITVHDKDENDNSGISSVVEQFKMIGNRTKAAVGLLAHVKKSGDAEDHAGDPDAGRGASSMKDACRMTCTYARMGRSFAEYEKAGMTKDQANRLRRRDDGKMNFQLRDADATWFSMSSVRLTNGDDVGVPVPFDLRPYAVAAEQSKAAMAGTEEQRHVIIGELELAWREDHVGRGSGSVLVGLVDLARRYPAKSKSLKDPDRAARDLLEKVIPREESGAVFSFNSDGVALSAAITQEEKAKKMGKKWVRIWDQSVVNYTDDCQRNPRNPTPAEAPKVPDYLS